MTEKKPSVSSSACKKGSRQARDPAFCGQTRTGVYYLHMTEVLGAGSREGFLGAESKSFTGFLRLERP